MAKILYYTSEVSPQSGAFRSLLFISRKIKKYGFVPVLFIHNAAIESGLLTNEEIRQSFYYPLPRLRLRQSTIFYLKYLFLSLVTIFRVMKVLRSENFDLVHINEIFDWPAAVSAYLMNVPIVWHIRDYIGHHWLLGGVLPRIVQMLASRVVVVSDSVVTHVFINRGLSLKKVVRIYNPSPDVEEFAPNLNGIRFRQEFGIPKDAFLVGSIARLVPHKGHHVFILSAPKVIQNLPNTYFVIVGGEDPYHKEYAMHLRRLVQSMNLDSQVIFTGYRSDIPHVMAACDIIVHCATYPDPFPGVVLQGMAMGKPVIASNLGGTQEQIVNGESGILIPSNNSEVLGEQICSLLKNEEKREIIAKAAIKRVRTVFTSETFFAALTSIYQALLEQR